MVSRPAKKGVTTTAGDREYVVWPYQSTPLPPCGSEGNPPDPTNGCCAGLIDCHSICTRCSSGQVCSASPPAACVCGALKCDTGSGCRSPKSCEQVSSNVCSLKPGEALDSNGDCMTCNSPRQVFGTTCKCPDGKTHYLGPPEECKCNRGIGEYEDSTGKCTVCDPPRSVQTDPVTGNDVCKCPGTLVWCAPTQKCVDIPDTAQPGVPGSCKGELGWQSSPTGCACDCTSPKVKNGTKCECPAGQYELPDGTCSTCDPPRTEVGGVCDCHGPNEVWDAVNKKCVCSPSSLKRCTGNGQCMNKTCTDLNTAWDDTTCTCKPCGPCEQRSGDVCATTCSGTTPICNPDKGVNGECVADCCGADTKGFCTSTACSGTWKPNAQKTCQSYRRYGGGTCPNCRPTDTRWSCTTDSVTGECDYLHRCNSATCAETWETCEAGGRCTALTNCGTVCGCCQKEDPPNSGVCKSTLLPKQTCDQTLCAGVCPDGKPLRANQTACCEAHEQWVGGKCVPRCDCCNTWDGQQCVAKPNTAGHVCSTDCTGTDVCVKACDDGRDPKRQCYAGTAYWDYTPKAGGDSDSGVPPDSGDRSWPCSASVNKAEACGPARTYSNTARGTGGTTLTGSVTMTCGDCGKWTGSAGTCQTQYGPGQEEDTCPGVPPNSSRPTCGDCETYDCTTRQCVSDCRADEECASDGAAGHHCVCKTDKKPRAVNQSSCCPLNKEWDVVLAQCIDPASACDDTTCAVQCIALTKSQQSVWGHFGSSAGCPNGLGTDQRRRQGEFANYQCRSTPLETGYKPRDPGGSCCFGKCCPAGATLTNTWDTGFGQTGRGTWECKCPKGQTLDTATNTCKTACPKYAHYWDADDLVANAIANREITYRGGAQYSAKYCGATFNAGSPGDTQTWSNSIRSASDGKLVAGSITVTCQSDGTWGGATAVSCDHPAPARSDPGCGCRADEIALIDSAGSLGTSTIWCASARNTGGLKWEKDSMCSGFNGDGVDLYDSKDRTRKRVYCEHDHRYDSYRHVSCQGGARVLCSSTARCPARVFQYGGAGPAYQYGDPPYAAVLTNPLGGADCIHGAKATKVGGYTGSTGGYSSGGEGMLAVCRPCGVWAALSWWCAN